MDIGEGALVAQILKHEAGDCPFCMDDDDVEHDEESDDEADTDEDLAVDDEADTEEEEEEEEEDEAAAVPGDHALIDNDSGKLERSMKNDAGSPRPTDWDIEFDVQKKKKAKGSAGAHPEQHNVTPNPHHLIPGNEALKECPDLLEWIFAAKGQISHDIGYSVNNAENGVWLPSNNSMRGDSRWKGADFKVMYARKAMKAAGGHFHDRHIDPYSKFVRRVLQKISDRMTDDAATPGCPFTAKEAEDDDELRPPPYALIPRLNGVSERIRGHLEDLTELNAFIYTSKLVMSVWTADKKPVPKKL